jgi:N-acyl-L-homoserine lactone synthetase
MNEPTAPNPQAHASVETPTESLLRQADELSRRAVAAAAPLRFEIVKDPAALEALYRLRYEVVIERGWARPEDLPGGREFDDYDAAALHLAAWEGDRLAAACRTVLPTNGLVLPTERAFDIRFEPHGLVADMGRQIVARPYTDMQHLVFAALLAQTWLEVHSRGFLYVGGDFTPAVTRLYRLMGFDVKQLGEARRYWGEDRFPIVVDVAKSTPALLRRWDRLLQRSA